MAPPAHLGYQWLEDLSTSSPFLVTAENRIDEEGTTGALARFQGERIGLLGAAFLPRA